MAKVAFWVTAGGGLEGKALSAIRLATRLKSQRQQDVEVYFFGPGVELMGRATGDLRDGVDALFAASVPAGVCPFNAQQFGVEDALRTRGFRMEPAGEALVRLVDEGYQVVGV